MISKLCINMASNPLQEKQMEARLVTDKKDMLLVPYASAES